jgi:hypothetical protein
MALLIDTSDLITSVKDVHAPPSRPTSRQHLLIDADDTLWERVVGRRAQTLARFWLASADFRGIREAGSMGLMILAD